jgi:hypothetical protein
MDFGFFVENGYSINRVILRHLQDKMTDYTTDLIKCYMKTNGIDDPDVIDCWEMGDWIDEVCETQDINDFVKKYVDFTMMLLDDDDFEIFVRHRDGTFENIGYFIPSQTEWNKVAKEYINNEPNSIYVIRAN